MTTATEPTAMMVEAMREELVATRRLLHRNPELGFHETETAALVAARLRAIDGIEDIHERVGGTGVTAMIRGARPGPVLLCRTDIDALPIHEATGASYASTRDGVMHACGHDGHTSILLAVARVLAARRAEFAGTAFLVFQPAEEILTGAQAMLDDGVMDLAGGPVAATLGLHLSNWLPLGVVGVRVGPSFAAVDRFTATITGRGGHGASPHQAIDPIVTAAEAVLALQRIISREINPLDRAVLSVCRIDGGSAFNIIPPSVDLEGTVRTFNPDVRAAIATKMERVLAGVSLTGEARHELTIETGPPAVVNSLAMCDLVRQAAVPVVGAANVIECNEETLSTGSRHIHQARPPSRIDMSARTPHPCTSRQPTVLIHRRPIEHVSFGGGQHRQSPNNRTQESCAACPNACGPGRCLRLFSIISTMWHIG